MVRMAEAIGRIVLAGREMTRLAGFTARITELIKVLDDISQGHYERTMVSDQNGGKEITAHSLHTGEETKSPRTGRKMQNTENRSRLPLRTNENHR